MEGRPLPDDGAIYAGDEGVLLGSRVLSEARDRKFEGVPRSLERRGGTWVEWMEACRGGPPAGCSFDRAGPLTEAVLLGNAAIRAGRALDWDPAGVRVPNRPEADRFLREPYENGWSLETI